MGHEVPVLVLNTDARIPALGFGTEADASPEEVKGAVVKALQLGYRHFDTASWHDSLKDVGAGLGNAIATGTVRREDIFVTVKIEEVDASQVAVVLQKSLRTLEFEYVDLCLLHTSNRLRRGCTYPPKDEELLLLSSNSEETWHALEECGQRGLARAIGLSNVTVRKLKDLLPRARIVPAVVQAEINPLSQQTQLVQFCRGVGIRVCAWHPFGGEFLSAVNDAMLKGLASKHGKTTAQVALRWSIDNGIVPIVTDCDSDRLSEFRGIFEFKLSDEESEMIASIPKQKLSLMR